MSQAFEKFPKLASYIKHMANCHIRGMSLTDWCSFLDELNSVLDQRERLLDWCVGVQFARRFSRNLSRMGLIMTNDQIKHMVDRFLGYELPENFNPDGGITFEPLGNKGTQHEYKRRPTGTNLLDAAQAEAMVRHMVEGLPERSRVAEEGDAVQRKQANEIATLRAEVERLRGENDALLAKLGEK